MKIRFSLFDNLLSLLIDLWQVWYFVFFTYLENNKKGYKNSVPLQV